MRTTGGIGPGVNLASGGLGPTGSIFAEIYKKVIRFTVYMKQRLEFTLGR